MSGTNFKTYPIAASGPPTPSMTPTTIAKARDCSLRVQLSNVGPVVIFVSQDPVEILHAEDTYRIIPSEQHVLVLAPKQSLYAVAAGTGGLLSVSSSDVAGG